MAAILSSINSLLFIVLNVVFTLAPPVMPSLVENRLHFPSFSDFPVPANHFVGRYDVPNTISGSLFYMFFESRNGNRNAPVMIWLGGDIGHGGEVPIFYGNGPFRITNELELTWNKYGWDKESNIIFVDNPIGVGYSHCHQGDLRRNRDSVTRDLYLFLQAFFDHHPLLRHNEFFVAGQSHVGHYVAPLAYLIKQRNTGLPDDINLVGFAIGNGNLNLAIQAKGFLDYALEKELLIINSDKYTNIKNVMLETLDLSIQDCESSYSHRGSCEMVYNEFHGIIREISGRPDLDYNGGVDNFSKLVEFMKEGAVKNALDINSNVEFRVDNEDVLRALKADLAKNNDEMIDSLLDNGIRFLLYAGKKDLVFNYKGINKWLHEMGLSHEDEFVHTQPKAFIVDDNVVGELTMYETMSYVVVKNGGRSVPTDEPEIALEMIKRWMQRTLE